MLIKQLSVFVENKTGRLSAIVDELAKANIDISALSMADTTDFGVLRLIVSDTDKAKAVLREAGVAVKSSDVLAIEMEDKPGAFAGQLAKLSENGVAVEYMYAFTARKEGHAMMVLRVDDPAKAEELIG